VSWRRALGLLLYAIVAFTLLAPAGALASAGPAPAPPAEPAPIVAPLHNVGRWLVDAEGRVVVLHGVNLVAKVPPYLPQQMGFGGDDAAYLESQGFNLVRAGVIFGALVPAPGQVDGTYLAGLHDFTTLAARYRLLTLLDVHQDSYGPVFGGEGFPSWMTVTSVFHGNVGTEPATNTMDPGLLFAWSNLYANARSEGVGIQDAYDDGLTALARSFASAREVVGYGVLNEPWAGTQWLLCARPAGCQDFERDTLTPFTRRAVAAVRRGDPSHVAWYEPVFFFSYGTDTAVGSPEDGATGFSFHLYCPGSEAFGALDVTPCAVQEESILSRAERVAARNGSTLMNTEWGASDDVRSMQRLADEMDEHMVSWAFWAYYDCCGGPEGDRGLIVDPNRPPAARNLTQPKLDALVRPYPQAIAGTPAWYRFDHASRTFQLVYSTSPPAGTPLAAGALTQVFVGSRSYPRGYHAEVSGADVVTNPCAPFVALRAHPGVPRVELRLTPGACTPATTLATNLRPPVAPDGTWTGFAVIALGWLAAATALVATLVAGARLPRLLG